MQYLSEKDKSLLLYAQATVKKILKFSDDHDSPESLDRDIESLDAILMNFIVIGEIVHKLSDDCKSQYPDIPWVKIKDLRNVIAHDYFSVETVAIWQVIQNYLTGFYGDIEHIINE